jgi:protein phosphatase
MRRRGQLTERQAEEHPQRSIITRALGPEAQVDVDTMTVSGAPGDVVLLCSDGLTTMVPESRIAEIIGGARTLDVGVRQLIKEANTEGGRDNITVVAFRLEGAEAPAKAEDVTLVGPTAEEAGLTAETVGAATGGRRRRPGAYKPAPRSRRRRVLGVLAAVAVLAVIVGGAVYGARQIYFLGTDDGGRMALYRGLPYDLPAGVSLYSQQSSAPIQVASLPANRRDSVTNHELRSHDDAVSLFDDLERSAAIPSGGGGGGKSGGGKGQGANGGGGSAGGGSSPQGGGGGSGGKGSQQQ